MMKLLMRLWSLFPLWVHILAARLVRPRFRAAVAAIIFDEQGRILLFKHTYRKFPWGIPAGGLEHREQPEDAVVREFREESGMKIEVKRLLLAESSRQDHHISLVYECALAEGVFRPSPEVSEMKYFDVDQLPAMLFAEKDLIRRLVTLKHLTPDTPTPDTSDTSYELA